MFITNSDQITKPPLLLRVLNTFDTLSEYLIIFGLAGGGIANVILYYFGTHNTDLRAPLFIIVAATVFCLASLRFLQIYAKKPDNRRTLLRALVIPTCGLLIFVGAFVLFGKSAAKSIDLLMQFGCFCIPAFIFGIDCMLHRREFSLFKTLDIISVLYIPFVVLCIYTMLSSNNVSGIITSVGEFNYMNIAYILLLPLAFLVVSFVLLPERLFLSLHAEFFRKSSSIICFGLTILFWYVILGTGTRGAMACVFGLLVFLMIWTAFSRNKTNFLRSIIAFFAFVLLFVLVVFVIKSDYLSAATSRVNYFFNNLLQGEFKTSSIQAVGRNDLDKIIVMPPDSLGENESTDLPVLQGKYEAQQDTALDPSVLIMNREQLYYAAWREFLKSPVFGIGPMGFSVKYDRYAHNIFLEILCDYGIVGALLIFGCIVVLAIRLLKSATNNILKSAMLALLVCMNLPLLFSGTFITWPSFWFFLGYVGMLRKTDSIIR